MAAGRPSSLVATCDSWVRASHHQTAVEGSRGELTLTWSDPDPVLPEGGVACLTRGLAADRLCRVYRLRPGGIDRTAVGPTAAGLDYVTLPEPVTIVGAVPAAGEPTADFQTARQSPLVDAVGIAIDANDRLFVADAGGGSGDGSIHVLDLWSRRLLRSVAVATPTHPSRIPAGLAVGVDWVFAAVRNPAGLLRLSATRGPVEVDLPPSVGVLPAGAEPRRVAVLPDGSPVVLFVDPGGDGWLVAGTRPPHDVGPASDIAVDADGAVVIAPCPRPEGRATFRRVVADGNAWTRAHPLDATGYDGTGVVVTPDGRVGYFTDDGFRLAVVGRVTYATRGHCVTYRLDSGAPRNQWGRVFLEACVPDGTECRVAAVTSDDDQPTAIAHTVAEPAECVASSPTATPPLPPPPLAQVALDRPAGLHARPGPVTPWWDARSAPRYETFEAPVLAEPGRYLWVTVHLAGNQRRTPRVREIRVEHHTHSLLRRLPAVYAEEREPADFLGRFLAPLDGLLHDLDLRAVCRDILVDPWGTPAEALDWLASFVGLVLDGRWAMAARRRLVAEIVPLYRRRGTLWSVARYLELYLAGEHAADVDERAWIKPVIVEHFRLRGLGGPLLGEDPAQSARSVVGFGFRVGGAVGDGRGGLPSASDLAGAADAFATAAHRFSVLIPRPLGADDEAAVRHVLDTERPAHTAYELCTVDAGMRVGRNLHLGLSSIVGPTGAFDAAVADRTLLGRGSILGGRATGVAVEAGRIGTTARVG